MRYVAMRDIGAGGDAKWQTGWSVGRPGRSINKSESDDIALLHLIPVGA